MGASALNVFCASLGFVKEHQELLAAVVKLAVRLALSGRWLLGGLGPACHRPGLRPTLPMLGG